MTWRWLAEHWSAISNDLHAVYGIDTSDRALMRARTWTWLSCRIRGLMERRTSILWLSLNEEERGEVVAGRRGPWPT